MEFVGKGYLVEASCYDAKDESTGKLRPRYKYVVLVGDEDSNSKSFGYLLNAHVETCISDEPVLNGDEKFMSVVDVKVTLRSFRKRQGDGFVTEYKPSYVIVPKIK